MIIIAQTCVVQPREAPNTPSGYGALNNSGVYAHNCCSKGVGLLHKKLLKELQP